MIKYAPIMTKYNNRYRGPFESYKDIAFESDITYNINFLKEKIGQFENELNHINKTVKSNNDMYNELRANLRGLKHEVDNHTEVLNEKR